MKCSRSWTICSHCILILLQRLQVYRLRLHHLTLVDAQGKAPRLLTMFSTDVCSAPHAFSHPYGTRRYIASTSTILSWSAYSAPRLLAVSSANVYSAPHAF
jgi:hypothetical protein